MNINLPLYDNGTKSYDTVVNADIVDIAPHLASLATFAVHRSPWPEEPGWCVTNVETGSAVVTRCTSRTEAVEMARDRLAQKTPAETAAAVEAGYRDDHGIFADGPAL